jgi:hypothetical protein
MTPAQRWVNRTPRSWGKVSPKLRASTSNVSRRSSWAASIERP